LQKKVKEIIINLAKATELYHFNLGGALYFMCYFDGNNCVGLRNESILK